jgi:hypothetical protein
MKRLGLWAILGLVPVWAVEMPPKAAEYHAALMKRPESVALFDRFRDAWLEERTAGELEEELAARAQNGDAGAWAILGRVRRMAGQEEAALEAFSKAREISPAAWLNLEMAKLRLAAKDFAGAEKDALAVPEGSKERGEALKLAGLACLRSERLDEAMAHWAQAVAAAPEDKGLLEDLAELTRKEGRLDLALDFCTRWRDASEDPYAKAMATLRRADLLLGSQRFDEAMDEFNTVLKASGDGSWLENETIARAEQAHRQRGDSRAWAAWVGEKAEEHPTRLNFRRVQSQALAAAGKYDEALEILGEVLKRSPGDMAARWQRVDLLARASKLEAAFDESKLLAAEEKSEFAALRWAELAFQLEKKDEVKLALDAVMAAAAPARRVGLAGHYARYGLPAESERIWRELATGEDAPQALRELARHLRALGRDKEAVDAWKQLGTRDAAGDRIEAAQMLAAAGEMDAAREVLVSGREKFSKHPGYEAALAELALMAKKPEDAREIYLGLARAAQRPDELASAIKGWLRTIGKEEDPTAALGDSTADRCARAAWLASLEKALPEVIAGDLLERSHRLSLLREHGKWADAVALMETAETKRGPLFFSELAEAKTAAGDLPGALAAARAWREAAPDQPGSWLREADALQRSEQLKDAELLLRRASSRFEDNEEIARRLFTLLRQAPSSDDALVWAWKRHDRAEDEALRSGWLKEILRFSRENNRLDDLQERLEDRARRDPASPGPLKALAELANARGDSREELDLLRRAAVNAPRDVSLISAIAMMEERSGDIGRALDRYQTLARLVPGPDSARQLAHAKIRLGDIEGGVRDLQSMAGEKGLDLRALENCAGDLACRGFIEEATRLATAVEMPRRDARFQFMLGCLLQMDGHEADAVEAYATVLAEPDDPAEANPDNPDRFARGETLSVSNLSSKIAASIKTNRLNGFQSSESLQIPASLVDAKHLVKERLAQMAFRKGGPMWNRVAPLIPEFEGTSHADWQELLASGFVMDSDSMSWLDFMEKHPQNPLGMRLFLERGQYAEIPEARLEALLSRQPRLPVEVEMKMRQGRSSHPLATVAFLESLSATDWQNEDLRKRAMGVMERIMVIAGRAETKPPVPLEAAVRALAIMEKTARVGIERARLPLYAARIALLENRTDDFVRHLNALEPPSDPLPGSYGGFYYFPTDLFADWIKKHGEKAADALIARLSSPLMRCHFQVGKSAAVRMKLLDKELAALPADAPREVRRGLVRLKLSCFTDELAGELRKYLEELVADPSDPRLVLEARLSLGRYDRGDQERQKTRALLEPLIRQLSASNDESDRQYAARYEGYLKSTSPSQSSSSRPAPPPTRWGSSASYQRQSSYRSEQQLAAILQMEDPALASRAIARLLETTARSAPDSTRSVAYMASKIKPPRLLEDALALIPAPSPLGLNRQLAMIRFFDGCGKPETALSWLANLAKDRPEETEWTVQLALRSPDDAEMARLLDSVAERPDFDATLAVLALAQHRDKPELLLISLDRLAEWASRSPGPHDWLGSPLIALSSGQNGLPKISSAPSPQLDCFRRYLTLAEKNPAFAEIAFRTRHATRIDAADESALTDAARTALLTGAYQSKDRELFGVATFRSQSLSMPESPSALEHLVLMARSIGDEAAFPQDFLTRLRGVDPASADWIAGMLAAKETLSLPGISDFNTHSKPWPDRLRHDAAVLRAVNLAGREKWLQQALRDVDRNQLSYNVRHVACEILLEARRKKSLSAKIISLLEASTGPRKDWNKAPTKEEVRQGNQFQAHYKRSQIATFLLNSVANCESGVMLDVIKAYREEKITPAETSAASNALGRAWRSESLPPRNAKLVELVGSKPTDAFLIGFWSDSRQPQPGKPPEFVWVFPDIVRMADLSPRDELLKNIINNPDAPLIDLLHTWAAGRHTDVAKRLLIKAAPGLASIPEGIRGTVMDAILAGIKSETLPELPPIVAKHLQARLATQRELEIKQARTRLDYFRKDTSSTKPLDLAENLGSIAGNLIGQDEKLLQEVLSMIEPYAAADRSGAVSQRFTSNIVRHRNEHPRWAILTLRLLDSFWQKHPPAASPPGLGDPLEQLYHNMPTGILWDAATWQEIARLSPAGQARFCSHIWNAKRGKRDPALDEKLRSAAKANPLTLATLDWNLETETTGSDSKQPIDQDKLIAYLTQLKSAGVAPAELEEILCRNLQLPRMKNPAACMAAIPRLLDGVKSVSSQHFDFLLQQVRQLAAKHANDEPTPEQLADMAALLKFIAAKRPAKSPNDSSYIDGLVMPVVLATGDDELIQLWVKNASKSLAGDLPLIIYLLERDLIPQAADLVPVKDGFTNASSIRFDAKMETLVAKLRKDPSPQAFRLAVMLSIDKNLRDVGESTGTEEPPHESREVRRKRLLTEYTARVGEFSAEERLALAQNFNASGQGFEEVLPILHEFADEKSAKAFRKSLLNGESSPEAKLFLAAICSLAHDGDLTGMERLAAMLSELNGKSSSYNIINQLFAWIPPSLIAYANRHDAKLTPAASNTYLQLGRWIAKMQNNSRASSIGSYLIHLGAMDAATLQRELQEAGLDNVQPRWFAGNFFGSLREPQTLFAAIRVGILHPVSSAILITPNTLDMNRSGTMSASALPRLLAEPALRAKLPPAAYRRFTGAFPQSQFTVEDYENMKKYAAERRADFSPEDAEAIDRYLLALSNLPRFRTPEAPKAGP